MTEDEAKTKRCCGPADCGYHNPEPYPARWCIGSACMAWRVSDRATTQQEEQTGDRPEGYGWYALDPNRSVGPVLWLRDVPGDPVGGYCGLAGSVTQ